MKKINLKELIKAILFVSGDGIEINTFALKFGYDLEEVRAQIESLKKEYSGDNGIHLINFANKVQFSSNPFYVDEIASVLNPIRERALTKATMQTLAIIAYKQPVTRIEIETIRGVNADYAIQILLEHNLIEVVGRKDTVGKPLLFGTTELFLRRFDLDSLDALPNYTELLERIKLIKISNEEKINKDLYDQRDIEISNDEDIHQGEQLDMEKITRLNMQEDVEKKLKGIDSIIRNSSKGLNKIEENKDEKILSTDEIFNELKKDVK